MQYILNFFTTFNRQEKFLTKYTFDTLPHIPRKKDHIMIEDDEYLVKAISTSYDDDNLQSFDIVLEPVDYDKEWWE